MKLNKMTYKIVIFLTNKDSEQKSENEKNVRDVYNKSYFGHT